MAVKDENNIYYYINTNTKYIISSKRILDSWNFKYILEVNSSSLKGFKDSRLGFRNGSLVRSIHDGKYYVITESKKRLVTNPDVLESFPPALLVSEDELNLHSNGDNLN